MIGDESHSGSHSPYYGTSKYSGGGSLVGKACHPLSAILHLNRKDVYVAEKLGTKQGWSKLAPDED